MATTPVVVPVNTDIRVIDKYIALLRELFQDESVYARTKETLDALLASGDLSGADKAKVIAEVVSNLNNGLVNASLSTALQWAKDEVAVNMQKEELGYQLTVLQQQANVQEQVVLKTEQDVLLTEAQKNLAVKGLEEATVKISIMQKQLLQAQEEVEKTKAETKRLNADALNTSVQTAVTFGIASVDSTGKVTAVNTTGTKTGAEIKLMTQNELNAKAEENVLKSKLKESQAAVYKIVADSVANFGNGTYTISDTGVTSAGFDSPNSLSYFQKQIAQQQAKGYAYNAWANAVNASSTAVSMLLSTESNSSTIENAAGELSGYLVSGVQKLITQAVIPT